MCDSLEILDADGYHHMLIDKLIENICGMVIAFFSLLRGILCFGNMGVSSYFCKEIKKDRDYLA